jgi:RNA polymerase sigma factor (sigma-70 family)
MTDNFIEEYSNFVYGIAKNFKGYLNKEDLIQAGFLGLIKAKKNYEENEFTKFTTYAYPYILGEMCTLVREDKSIKINRNLIRLKTSIEKANNYLSQKYLRKPTNEELASFLEVSLEDIDNALKTINLVQSIDEPICDSGKEMSLYDVIPSRSTDIDSLLLLKDALLTLDSESRNMLLCSLNMNQTEIGKLYNINQVQVSRKLTKIKEKIKSKVA